MSKTKKDLDHQENSIHYAGDFDGDDSLNQCDVCGDPYMMSQLTTIHRGGEVDEFICGMCAMNRLSSGLLKQ